MTDPTLPTQQVQVTPRTMRDVLMRLIDANVGLTLNGIDEAWDAMDAIEAEAARSVPVAEGLREALESTGWYIEDDEGNDLAYDVAADWLTRALAAATPPDPAEGQEPAVIDVERLEQAWSSHMDRDHDANDYDGCWPGHSERIAAQYARLSLGARRKGAGEPE